MTPIKLDTENLDRLIQAAFPGPADEDIYQNGLCRAFAIGLDSFLRKRDPAIETRLLIAFHEGTFDHVALQVPSLGASFDSRGSGAQEKWTAHRGEAVDWTEDTNLRCRITGGRLNSVFRTDWRHEAGKVEKFLETALPSLGGETSTLPDIAHVPACVVADLRESSTRLQR